MLGSMTAEAVCRALMDGLTEQAVVAIDRDGRVATWNAGAERLTGYPREEAVGRSIAALDAADVGGDEAHARVHAAIASTVATGRADYEGWRVRKDGGRYWGHTRLAPLRDARGEIAGLALVMRDDTERQAGSDALVRSRALFADRERYLQAVLDTQPECVMVAAPDGALLDMNAAGLAMVQAGSLTQLRGTRIRDIVLERHRDACDALHARALGGSTGTLEFEIVGLRGRTCWLESRSVPLRDGTEAVVAVLSVVRDVSARREARTLRRSEELFHGVVSLASDAIVTVDEDRRIVLFNRAAEDAFGYAAGEMLGRSLDPLLPPGVLDDGHVLEPAADVERRAPSPHPIERREVEGRRKNGERFPAEVAVSRSSAAGQVRYTAIVRDVSEQRRLAAALQAVADELARSNAELEQFAYVASHDLQEPLRMVSSYTQLLAQRYQGQLDERADKYIHYAVDGAQRMQVLIDDLLTLSRVGTGGRAPTAVDAGAVVTRALATVGDAVHASGARIDVGALPAVHGDAGQLTQLFQNLIGNALKFARPGTVPALSITAAPIATERPGQDRWWTFAVRDAGIGLDMRHAVRIFAMFQRLHTRDEYPGTGIGLAICRKIVERHGGRIWVESAPGEGATFRFTLPQAR